MSTSKLNIIINQKTKQPHKLYIEINQAKRFKNNKTPNRIEFQIINKISTVAKQATFDYDDRRGIKHKTATKLI